MTDTLIKDQIKTIQQATEKAIRSKKTALKFLTDAGIINNKRMVVNDDSARPTTKNKRK